MKKILSLLIVGIFVLSGFGAVALQNDFENLELNAVESKTPIIKGRDYTHTILGEFGTATWCSWCIYAHGALKNIYAGGWHPFYYVTLIGDKNTHSYERLTNDYNFYGYPTLWFDGGYKVNVGASSEASAQAAYNSSILSCGNRVVNDIDLSLDVSWLGPGNPIPNDGATDEPIDVCLNWTNAEMKISVSIDNNDESTYDGTLNVYVTEVVSSMGWYDYAGNLYTFPLLDFAYNEEISINAGETWEDSTDWDGKDYNDGYGNDFGEITQENVMVIGAVFDDEWHQGYSYPPMENPFDAYYVDETAGCLAGNNTDPKTYDVYFGESNPPPKVSSNQSDLGYCPSNLEFDTTYYWQIVVWDNQGASISGPVWSFTTRGNVPPNTPDNPNPEDNETSVPIDTCLSWTCEDPDGDDITYDVFFGEFIPDEHPPLVSNNQTETTYCPDDVLDFEKWYVWRIVAWDQYGLKSTGEIWRFKTEDNFPPNNPCNPDPQDGATDISIEDLLKWTGGDPNSGDKVTYDVYYGKNSPPPLVDENLFQTAYDPGTMDYNTRYYWKIVAKDSQGLTATSPIWHFTTEYLNLPPTAPDIDGPSKGSTFVELCWTFHSDDPNNDLIKYIIKWGDGTSDETDFYSDSQPVEICHIYGKEGDYIIEASSEDQKGLASGKNTLKVTIPRFRTVVYHPLLLCLFESFPNVFLFFRHLLGL